MYIKRLKEDFLRTQKHDTCVSITYASLGVSGLQALRYFFLFSITTKLRKCSTRNVI